MNLENIQNKKNTPAPMTDDFDFDFKPITSGLGFHHNKTTDIKPVFTEKTVVVSPLPTTQMQAKKEMNVYQNDLSLFYGQAQATPAPVQETIIKEEKIYRLASKPQRVVAYFTDLLLVSAILGIVLTVMARTISMDLMDVWMSYPHEITPLVVTLFSGFYLMYFSIFEMTGQSTLGKTIFNLRVTTLDNKALSLTALLARTAISLLNFASLGLFSYFDLQNKVTDSKVIRMD